MAGPQIRKGDTVPPRGKGDARKMKAMLNVRHGSNGLTRIGRGAARMAPMLSLLLALLVFPALNRASESEAAGRQVFEKRCTGCHALERNFKGPRLGDVLGRKAGSAPGYTYSAALRAANFTWDEARLNQWLTDPDSVVDDNNMDFHLPSAEERMAVIAFLKLLAQQHSMQH